MDDFTRWEEYAPKEYSKIRNLTDDVETISKNTGWPQSRIQRIKDHLFYQEHQLRGRVGRFDADPDIADG